jgi:hypothetical protein
MPQAAECPIAAREPNPPLAPLGYSRPPMPALRYKLEPGLVQRSEFQEVRLYMAVSMSALAVAREAVRSFHRVE